MAKINNLDNFINKILSEEIEKKSNSKIEELFGRTEDSSDSKPRITSSDLKRLRDRKTEERKYLKNLAGKKKTGLDEVDMEEGNEFTGELEKARKEGKKEFEVGGKKYPVKETDMEEGNEFTGELEKARKEGKKEFEVGGKRYPVKESKKWIQKTDMKKGALHKRLGIPEDEKIPVSELKKLKKELQKKGEGDKKLSASDLKLLKQVNLALNLKSLKEEKETITLTENEMIDLIEKIVLQEKEEIKVSKVVNKLKDNISKKYVPGLAKTEKAQSASKKENDKYASEVTKKMMDYLKDGSKGKFETEPEHFPKGNGELGEMEKKTYQASDAVEEYIENFAHTAGMENLHYDEINPDKDWVDDNIKGSSRTGNNPKWANAVETEVNEKIVKKKDANLYQKAKQQSYKRVPSPVTDVAGETRQKGSMQVDKLMNKLESVEEKNKNQINEEMEKMKNLIKYNQNTQ